MKKLLLPILLLTGKLMAQTTPCATEPCNTYVPYDQCCTGQLRTFVGNQCLSGPGILDSSSFGVFNFLSFRNLTVNATVNFTTGDKALYTQGAVTIDTLLLNGGDVINKLNGSLTINNLIFTGTGNVTLWLRSGENVTINGTTYVDGQEYTNSFGTSAKILVRTCVATPLSLRPVVGNQLRPDVVYPFVLREISTGRKRLFTGTYLQMKKSLPMFVAFAYTVRMSLPEKVIRVD